MVRSDSTFSHLTESERLWEAVIPQVCTSHTRLGLSAPTEHSTHMEPGKTMPVTCGLASKARVRLHLAEAIRKPAAC